MNDEQKKKLVSQAGSTGETPQPHVSASIDCRQIDRLVDGELTEAETRELLLTLDRHPDGWRRCALAFLEAQCLRAELADIGKMSDTRTNKHPATAATTSGSPKSKAWPWLVRTAAGLAMAASLLAAMMLGAVWQQWRTGGAVVARQDLSDHSGWSAGSTGEQRKAFAHFPAQPQLAVPGAGQQWQTVTIALQRDADAAATSIQLPVREHNHFEETLLEELPASIPPEIWEGLESVGCRVVQHRQLLTLPLDDGRTLLLPVDSVELTCTGQNDH